MWWWFLLACGADDSDDSDDDDPDCAVPRTVYYDVDDDGYGTLDAPRTTCEDLEGYSDLGGDCDDLLATVNPGATEVDGNGIDDDCDGNVDGGCAEVWYADLDGDGYGDADASTVACTEPADHVADATDCDDADGDVNPGVTEVDGNGIDDDCDGEVDGSACTTTWYADADQDGYGDPSASKAACKQPNGYVADASDCADSADQLPAQAPVGPEDVYPGATDASYDGVDADCAGDNDFDADGDLYIADAHRAAYDDYVLFWGIDEADCKAVTEDLLATVPQLLFGVCGGDECDDDDGNVHPNDPDDARPGVIEALGDAVDADCDGGDDTTPMRSGNLLWDTPRNVVVGRNGLHWLVVTAADAGDAMTKANSAVGLLLDPAGSADDGPIEVFPWFVPQDSGTVQVVGARIDMIPFDAGADQGFYAAVPYTNDPTTADPSSTYLLLKRVTWDADAQVYFNRIAYRQISGYAETYADVDLRIDGDGDVWGIGCGPTAFTYVVADSTTNFGYLAKQCYGVGNGCVVGTPAAATQCFVEPPAGAGTIAQGTVCVSGDCTTYDLDGTAQTPGTGITDATAQPYATQAYGGAGIDWAQGHRVIVPATGPGVTVSDGGAPRTLLGSYTVRAAAADVQDGVLYVVAAVADVSGDGTDDLVFSHGPAAGTTFTDVEFPLIVDGFVFSPREVSVAADADRVLIGASGDQAGAACRDPGDVLCDVVAWSFVSP